ncbi:uncharacterized protein LOC142163859 [Nicotiana tabacum]|uniref:Uncharacterized protein LOC142163859 n=1 Tax=Nicotiana tabacum TaxID=4097 RepID=A0AC58RWI1_TOBAC
MVTFKERIYGEILSSDKIQLLSRLLAKLDSANVATSNHVQSGTAFVAHFNSWIVDSGANRHMIGSFKGIQNYSLCPKGDNVKIANGSLTAISGIGYVICTPNIKLSSVLHVPEFPVSLLSVSAITKALNCKIEFFPDHCIFQDFQTEKRIGSGRLRDDLYILDGIQNSSQAFLEKFDDKVKILRNDNGSEYTDKRFGTYLESNGIVHQTSCPYTSAQNVVSERRNRHLLEVARSLMFTMPLLKAYWRDVILVAAYFINRQTPQFSKFSRSFKGKVSNVIILPLGYLLLAWMLPFENLSLISVLPHHLFRGESSKEEEGETIGRLDRPDLKTYSRRNRAEEAIMQSTKAEPSSTGELSAFPNELDLLCLSISSISIPKNWREDFADPKRKQGLIEEMKALSKNKTWEFVTSPLDKKLTFLSCATNLDWDLQQFDTKNAFLHGDLEEEVYMEIHPRFNTAQSQGKFNVNNIVITGDDKEEMIRLKKLLAHELEIKDLGKL